MPRSQPVRIGRPYQEIADLLSVRPNDWIEPFVRIAVHAGEAAAARSVRRPSSPGDRRVDVELQPAVSTADDQIVVALRWRTAGFDWIPPAWAGRILVRGSSEGACAMTVEGSYALPSTVVGRSQAQAVAVGMEAAVAMFLRSFRVAVEEQARQTG